MILNVFAETMDLLYNVIMDICKSCLCDPIKQHTAYLLCYGRLLNKLKDQVENLKVKRDVVKQDVDDSRDQGMVIRGDVQKWLDDVDEVTELEDLTVRSANAKCCNRWCWNPIVCYGLGKEAAKKKVTIDELLREGTFPRVARSPPPPPIRTSGFQLFTSTKLHMERILGELQNDRVNIIAVYGMGGVGKTTLMKEVAKKAERERLFDKVVMVTVSQNVIIRKIQQDIADAFALKFEQEEEQGRARKLSARLHQVGTSLVILDDLWKSLELSDVGIPCGDEHNRCKIVITTRRFDVCNLMNSQVKIKVNTLGEEDSWKLFQANAGDVVDSHELSDVPREVVRECKGLPLAIVVLGKALNDRRDVKVWNDVLECLRNATPRDISEMEPKVFISIKFSFDHLRSEDAKLCFLFCCLCPEDHNILPMQVAHYMVGERQIGGVGQTLVKSENKVHHLMDYLKASGLLLEGNVEGFVKMHDIVRDVAIWISKEEPYKFYSRAGAGLEDWPMITKEEECQRISLSTNLVRVLPEEPLKFPKLRTLILSHNKIDALPSRFFLGMQALQVLDLELNIELSSLSMSLLSNLRVLNLSGCGLGDISSIPTLKSLEILDLSSQKSNIGHLSTEFGELTNLRHLNLSETRCMIPYDLISRLSRLEELHMKDGFNEWQPQGSEGETSLAAFAELACLPRLTTLHIHVSDSRCFTQELEDNAALKNLERFSILLPDFFLKMTKGNSLIIVSSVVPRWTKLLAGIADNLSFRYCPGMEWLASTAIGQGDDDGIPSSTFSNISWLGLYDMEDLRGFCVHGSSPSDGFLGSLKQLTVVNCSSLEYALTFASTLQHLESFMIYSCGRLQEILPSQLELLPNLSYLNIFDCGQLQRVFGSQQASFPNLLSLTIANCGRLQGIFPSQLELPPNLEYLYIHGCGQLERIFGSQQASFSNLRYLIIGDCGSLAALFSWRHVQSMRLLEDINVSECDGLVTLITSSSSSEGNSKDDAIGDKTSVLPRLRSLTLRGLIKITSFDEEGVSVFEWPSLEKIKVLDCPNLKKLPLMAQSAPNLQRIEGSEEWFHALEWADESVKSRLQPLLH